MFGCLKRMQEKGCRLLASHSWARRGYRHGYAYYKPTNVEPVDIDEALKAGHCVEPFKGMQFCAAADDIEDRRTVKSAVDPNTISLFVLERTLRGQVDDPFWSVRR